MSATATAIGKKEKEVSYAHVQNGKKMKKSKLVPSFRGNTVKNGNYGKVTRRRKFGVVFFMSLS